MGSVLPRLGDKIMNTPKRITRLSAIVTILGMASVALAPCAHATPVQIGFNGGGASGHASLTVVPDTVSGDPSGAEAITNALGTFSDANLGISNALITGVYAIAPAPPARTDDIPYVPKSFSYIPSVGGINLGEAASYDNLFYLDGSPQVCNPNEYPFSGGFLDVFGTLFTLGNGDVVNLFSFGTDFGFGLQVLTGSDSAGWSTVDYDNVSAAVPEPNFLWLFGAGVLGLFAWRRSTEMNSRDV
jgi:hypothetical protein